LLIKQKIAGEREPAKVIKKFILRYDLISGEDGKFQNSKYFLIPELITFKTGYVSIKSAEWMKSYSIIPKSIFPKSPNLPLHSSGTPEGLLRNQNYFWNTILIFDL
jgi:hypothetical protein